MNIRRPLFRSKISLAGAVALMLIWDNAAAQLESVDDSQSILSIDHYVTQISSVPSIEGEHTQLYVRERVRPGTIARGSDLEGRVALFVHGAGTPAEVAFDVPYQGYSWMAFLAAAGFDVFSVDMTGYGRSTRPASMNDPCNLSEASQRDLGIGVARGRCSPSHVGAATTIESDWADIDAAVDYIRELRNVDRVHLLGWSLGGPRAGGYSARHAEKVGRLVLLAPAYSRDSSAAAPASADQRPAMTSQSWSEYMAGWDGPTCANQHDPAINDVVFSEMLKSDPVGATWGTGVRRAPNVVTWGWNQQIVGRQTTPLLSIAAQYDVSVLPERVRELHADYGAEQKVMIDLGCASHRAMWEHVHLPMFEASLEWLQSGTVNGETNGIVRMGYRP
jgi:pimeloyl-ACP methyl ester carboxylesterase